MDELTVEQVVSARDRIMGGKGDTRTLSEANLHQMVFGANRVAGSLQKAAFVFSFLCTYPAFPEANNRTALAVSEQLLRSGGYWITGDTAELLALADRVALFAAEPDEIGQWFVHNVEKSIHY